MKLKEYIEKSARTDKDLGDKNRIHWLLGTYNEFGEMVGVLKKALVKGEDPDAVKLSDELADVNWYIAKGCRLTGFTMPDTYAYEEKNTAIEIIKAFNEAWAKEDIMGMYCALFNVYNFYSIDIEKSLSNNIAKLMARHPNGFDINNKKHTKEEQNAIKG